MSNVEFIGRVAEIRVVIGDTKDGPCVLVDGVRSDNITSENLSQSECEVLVLRALSLLAGLRVGSESKSKVLVPR